MPNARQDGLLLLLLGSVTFLLSGLALETTASNAMIDFKVLYYSARCLIEHRDPYDPTEIARIYQARDPNPTRDAVRQEVITHPIYPPTALLLTAPLALLPWGPAHIVWMTLIASSVLVAAYLIWRASAAFAPTLSGALIGLLLADCGLLLLLGNAAGIAVTLCIIGTYCIVEDKFPTAGVLCFAVSLLYKPHDGGLIWLALLLAGGVWRRRAVQTLALAAAVSIPAFLWVARTAPGWLAELRNNLAGDNAFAALNDPGRASLATRNPNMVIDLQAAVSVFFGNPHIYNLISAGICGALLIVWAVVTVRSSRTQQSLWLSIAVAAPLTMLVSYHRPHDAKLILLTMPACALLFAGRGAMGRIAILANVLAFLFVGTITLAVSVGLASRLHLSMVTFGDKILIVLVARPASVVLLFATLVYLVAYLRVNRTGHA